MAAPDRIKTVVIDVPLPERVARKLADRFPGVDFAFAGDPKREERLARAEAYVHWNLKPETLAAAPNLRWYQSIAAGVDDDLTPELLARDLIVTNNSGVHAVNMAEHVLAMMLAFARRLPFLFRAQIERTWKEQEAHNRMQEIFELNGQSLLVVGYGDIGRRLAKICSCLGMTVDAVKRAANGETDESTREIAPIGELSRLLASADQVAVCLPLTRETRGLFDAERFSQMKRGAYFYNVGRGPIVDTAALIDALESGQLGGAGLDVTDPEPLPSDSPLWSMENVIITAHTSGATPHYWERATEILAANIERINAGKPPLNLVNQQLGY